MLRFCQTYGIDSFRCADELFSFSRSFKKFDCSILADESLDEGYTDIEDEDEDVDLNCDIVSSVDDTNTANGSDTENTVHSNQTQHQEKTQKKQFPSFSDALKALCHLDYHSVPYSLLCLQHCSSNPNQLCNSRERSFSAL